MQDYSEHFYQDDRFQIDIFGKIIFPENLFSNVFFSDNPLLMRNDTGKPITVYDEDLGGVRVLNGYGDYLFVEIVTLIDDVRKAIITLEGNRNSGIIGQIGFQKTFPEWCYSGLLDTRMKSIKSSDEMLWLYSGETEFPNHLDGIISDAENLSYNHPFNEHLGVINYSLHNIIGAIYQKIPDLSPKKKAI